MKSARFRRRITRKGGAKARAAPRPAARKPVGTVYGPAPISRVGANQDHRDTLTHPPHVLFVLVDAPTRERDHTVVVEQQLPSHTRKVIEEWVALDTPLVIALAYAVTDGGKYSLTQRRGESEDQQTVEILKEVESEHLFLHDEDLAPSMVVDGGEVPSFARLFDTSTVELPPHTDDAVLKWHGPYSSLTEDGSGD